MKNFNTLTLMALGTIAAVSLSACNSSDGANSSSAARTVSAPANAVVAPAPAPVVVVAPPAAGLPLYSFTIVSDAWSLNGAASTAAAPDLSAYATLSGDATYIQSIDSVIQTQQNTVELYSQGVLIGDITLPADGSAPSFNYSSNSMVVDSLAYSFTAGANSQTAGSAVLVFNLSECVSVAQGAPSQQIKPVQSCDSLQVTVNLLEVMPTKK